MKAIKTVTIMIACIIIIFIYAYAFEITMTAQQRNAIFLFFFLSFIGGCIYFLLSYREKPNKIKDEMFEAETFAKEAWYQREHQTLSNKFGRGTSSVFGTERMYAFLFSRMHNYLPVRIVVGTKPWRIADWEDNPKLNRERSDWNSWEIFGNDYVAKPSETLTDNDKVSRWNGRDKPTTQININKDKEKKFESLKDKSVLEKDEKE